MQCGVLPVRGWIQRGWVSACPSACDRSPARARTDFNCSSKFWLRSRMSCALGRSSVCSLVSSLSSEPPWLILSAVRAEKSPRSAQSLRRRWPTSWSGSSLHQTPSLVRWCITFSRERMSCDYLDTSLSPEARSKSTSLAGRAKSDWSGWSSVVSWGGSSEMVTVIVANYGDRVEMTDGWS